MRVADQEKNGDPRKITQHGLAKRSRVARSTIAKYAVDSGKRKLEINPDLETLCRLAHAFNVPPALLLMRPEDWARLAQAALTVVQAMRDEKVISISEQVAKHGKSDTVARAVAGLRIAERIGLCRAPARVDDEAALDIERVSEEMRR